MSECARTFKAWALSFRSLGGDGGEGMGENARTTAAGKCRGAKAAANVPPIDRAIRAVPLLLGLGPGPADATPMTPQLPSTVLWYQTERLRIAPAHCVKASAANGNGILTEHVATPRAATSLFTGVGEISAVGSPHLRVFHLQ